MTGAESTHAIRLRGPWDYRVLARFVQLPSGSNCEDTASLPAPGRIGMPADWGASLGADFRGRVLYARSFHKPTGLGPADRVALVFERVDFVATVRLNSRTMGEIRWEQGRSEFDVTAGLARSNQLEVEIESCPVSSDAQRVGREGLPGGLIGEVRLEIRVGP